MALTTAVAPSSGSVPLSSGSVPLTAQTLPSLSDAAITPALLAKRHLPGILLQHGPLAIRQITAHLLQTLPGFSAIPSPRQRRLIVSALEGRGVLDDSEVVFEKIGWGKWDCRRRGDPPRFTPESGVFAHSEEEQSSHDEDVDMGDADSTATDSDSDMTDEEDWAQMGAEMLRRQGGSPISSAGWSASFQGSPGVLGAQWKKPPTVIESVRAREEREAIEALVKLSSV